MKKPGNITAVFKALNGQWRFHRTLRSRKSTAPSGTVTGVADFVSNRPMEYRYSECGKFKSNIGDMEVKKEYIYTLEEAHIQVKFTDGKLYNEVTLDSNHEANCQHLCGDDTYVTKYKFNIDNQSSMTSFWVHHAVAGPTKDYDSETTFTKLV
jgi:hypothetical protein